MEMIAENKAKRVRTGCRTCRERHLKCDEGEPECNNCLKSNRECKRGVELKFNHTEVRDVYTIPIVGLKLRFEDCSRIIADEYVGGDTVYPPLLTPPRETATTPPTQYPVQSVPFNHTEPLDLPISLPPIQQPIFTNNSAGRRDSEYRRDIRHSYNGNEGAYLTAPSTSHSTHSPARSQGSNSTYHESNMPKKDYVDSSEEALLLQLYMEEVALWMDSMNEFKYFSEILPHDALQEPMLYQALLACGARHYTLVNDTYPKAKGLAYYTEATALLLRELQNPDRDLERCATTAVCLNVYEIMSEGPLQRMNHIAGARALVKEVGWNASSDGIGAACFWLNVGMEILSCLHYNWEPAWNPDLWQMDMNLEPETRPGKEEFWTQRALYIVGKVAGFRATKSNTESESRYGHEEQLRRHNKRTHDWRALMYLCERWNDCKPKTMRPLIRTINPKSCFLQVNLIGRATNIGQLFYHAAMCLLAQINPQASAVDPEMVEMKLHHAHEICGIVAHSQDRGIASAAIRCLAIGAEFLVDRREQEEIVEIFKRTREQTGWRVNFIVEGLKKKHWKWSPEIPPNPLYQANLQNSQNSQNSHMCQPTLNLPPMQPQPSSQQIPLVQSQQQIQQVPQQMPQQIPPQAPSGIVNPLYRNPNPYGGDWFHASQNNNQSQDPRHNYR